MASASRDSLPTSASQSLFSPIFDRFLHHPRGSPSFLGFFRVAKDFFADDAVGCFVEIGVEGVS
jgi:hypothetical protein